MNDETYENIVDIIKLDIDAVNAYEQAIDSIEETLIQNRLENFKDDHQRHVDDLSDYLLINGRTPPDESPDFKGYLLEGFTSLRSITGTDGALKAMKTNEELTNKKYDEAVTWDLEPKLAKIIKRNREDEQVHLAYIEEALTVKHKA